MTTIKILLKDSKETESILSTNIEDNDTNLSKKNQTNTNNNNTNNNNTTTTTTTTTNNTTTNQSNRISFNNTNPNQTKHHSNINSNISTCCMVPCIYSPPSPLFPISKLKQRFKRILIQQYPNHVKMADTALVSSKNGMKK